MSTIYSTWRAGLVVDVSRYQRRIRADILRAAGVRLVIAKIGQGTAMDEKFEQHKSECDLMSMPLAAYHWPDPIQSARPQAEAVLRWIDKYKNIRAICGDYEQWWSVWGTWYQAVAKKIAWAAVETLSPARISDVYEEYSEFIAARTATPLVSYTSKGFVTSHAPGMADWLARHPLWVAGYIYGGDKVTVSWDELEQKWLPKETWSPLLPPGAGRVVGWQFTGDKLMLPGMYSDEAGIERSPADVSLFDPAWLDLIIGQTAPVPEPESQPEPEPLTAGLPLQATVTGSPYINIRSGPGIGYPDIGDLPAGEVRNVLAVGGSDVWIEIESGKWACARTGARELMTIKQVDRV